MFDVSVCVCFQISAIEIRQTCELCLDLDLVLGTSRYNEIWSELKLTERSKDLKYKVWCVARREERGECSVFSVVCLRVSCCRLSWPYCSAGLWPACKVMWPARQPGLNPASPAGRSARPALTPCGLLVLKQIGKRSQTPGWLGISAKIAAFLAPAARLR